MKRLLTGILFLMLLTGTSRAETVFTPSSPSPYQDPNLNYWTLPMDITNEEAVWKALTEPVTVLDNGRKDAEKSQVVLRAGPSEEAEGVGVVTCVSQGVHVLERGAEWSLVECYSSSFYNSAVLNWNALVQGYVPTEFLREVVPNQELGLVVDKLTQRMYVFWKGKLYSTLLVSTGLSNAKQPYNETRSGEFLLVSKVGEFISDQMRCPQALRFNSGDMIHEVPYILYENGKDYSATEWRLGTKASHGCIRVQREETPEGVNQQWLWKHYKKNTKLLIWEDWQGRRVEVPDSETVLYRLNRNAANYHVSSKCGAVKGKKLQTLTYGQLEYEENRKLTPCRKCAAPERVRDIIMKNLLYGPGGDHDPVMTQALKTCPRTLKGK
jgi:L,D-transpeptidase catalytic domain.